MLPLLDLKLLNGQMQMEIEDALARVARSGRYILGEEVERFEQEWAAYCGVKHCVATGNCLDALRLILMSEGIGKGDEVIVAANTYIATWLAVSLVGATPVPVEPDPESFNMDPEMVKAALSVRTAAILPTHLYGRPAEMGLLSRIAEQHGLLLLADAAHAHGAKETTTPFRIVGSLAHAEAFSFYPSKNLGALGDAGAITTDDERIAALARRMRNYGGVGRLDHQVRGINSRMDEMQAAVLRVKLGYLDELNAEREERAREYCRELVDLPLVLPSVDAGSVFHQFVVRSANRDLLASRLQARGVEAHIHYPVPPHLEDAYADLCIPAGRFPITEQIAKEILSLPIGYDFDQEKVIVAVNGACRD